ncbi:hypothetical protein [Methanobrevibacter sp.]|uniref:hypothetical protein n=1 Tax=Methanobrevibacter sp. TaxID=66852 RepID=UPI00386B4E5B
MYNEILEYITNTIKKTFKDERPIKCLTPEHETVLDEEVHPGGFIFTTEDGDFIDFEVQLKDFDEMELTKYVEFAENLCEKHNRHVSVYLLCSKNVNVSVKECKIYSESNFTIKLACSQEDLCRFTLEKIKNKIKNNQTLNEDDLNALEMLPVTCDRKDRNYYRLEYFKIINRELY